MPRSAVLPAIALTILSLSATTAASDSGWVEVQGGGFTVVANGSEKQARAVLAQFTRVRGALAVAWPWARLDPSRPVLVLAVRNEAGMRELLPAYWERKDSVHPDGVFISAPDRHWVALRTDVAPMRSPENSWSNPHQVVFHEYVHLALSLNYQSLPAWLGEGLAEFWGSTVVDGDHIYVGPPIEGHLQTLDSLPMLPVYRLLGAAREQFSESNHSTLLYAETWALVHYLLQGSERRRGQLDRYLELLRGGQDEAAAAADAFGNPQLLGRELESYLRHRDRSVIHSYETNLQPDRAAAAATARVLPPAESLAVRAAFHVAAGRPAEAAALAAAALEQDASEPLAHEALALAAWRADRLPDAVSELELAVASPRASAVAHSLHGRLLWSTPKGRGSPERVEASLRRAVEMDPNLAAAHEWLALVRHARGAPLSETLPPAVRASQLEPSSVPYRITALRLTAGAGHLAEAQAAAERLLATARGEDRQRLQELLRELEHARQPPR